MNILCELKRGSRGIAKDAILPPGTAADAVRLKVVFPTLMKMQEIMNGMGGRSFKIQVDTKEYSCSLHQEYTQPLRAWYDEQWLCEIIIDVFGVDSIDFILHAKKFELII
jgi:hypothetical protein